MEILKAFRAGMNTLEIAKLYRMPEAQVYTWLHQEMEVARNNSALLPGRGLRDQSRGTVSPGASGPGGTLHET